SKVGRGVAIRRERDRLKQSARLLEGRSARFEGGIYQRKKEILATLAHEKVQQHGIAADQFGEQKRGALRFGGGGIGIGIFARIGPQGIEHLSLVGAFE